MTVEKSYGVSGKIKKFLHPNEQSQRIFFYLVPKLGPKLSKMRHLGFQSQFSRLNVNRNFEE